MTMNLKLVCLLLNLLLGSVNYSVAQKLLPGGLREGNSLPVLITGSLAWWTSPTPPQMFLRRLWDHQGPLHPSSRCECYNWFKILHFYLFCLSWVTLFLHFHCIA
mmetsp:Transcript_21620/g.27996  ORF Transcript_21620/g.27996 Transcript_21620/m.27996 type:complete len:105 (-) Transcript_21620:151-465(-)